MGALVIPQRSRHMEKVKAPEHRSFHRRYKGAFAIRVGVHAERNSDEVRREKSQRGPDRPGESFLHSDCPADNVIVPSYWMW